MRSARRLGKRGPVMLNIPRDLMDDEMFDYGPRPRAVSAGGAARAGRREAIRRATALLLKAERPVLLAGGGVVDSVATGDAVKLAERLDMALIPV